MRRRILQICPHDSAPFGELCRRYTRAAAAIDVEITSIYLAPPQDQPLPYAHYLNIEDLSQTALLRKALGKYTAQVWDLVLCHRYRAYWAVARTPLARQRCVVLAHEFGLLRRWQRRLARRLFAARFKFAGVSAAVANELKRSVGSVLVLPNVLDAQNDAQVLSRQQALQGLALEPGPFTIGWVGRLHYKKRPDLAIQAFQEFRQSCPGARLVMLGDGDLDQLRGAQQSADLSGVVVAGHVVGASQYFGAFDVLLHTAEYEPFGMVILEAMAAGVPVVTDKVAGPAAVLGDLGVYADRPTPEGFSSALLRAVAVDKEIYAAAARQRISDHFSVDALAQALHDCLEVAD